MIKFSLPDYCDHQKIINFFLTLQEKLPEAFYDNRMIDSAYGLPGHLIWNGGRVMVPRCSPQDYYEIVQTYHDNFPNFHLRHTCTNSLITEPLYYDYACNQWIKFCQKPHDAIIVNQDAFKDYILQTYPDYDIIFSTTKNLSTIEEYNNYCAQGLTVLNYIHNHNEDLISQLKYPQNIEILCAEECVPNCPNRQKHYEIINKTIMQHPDVEDFSCPYEVYKNPNFYTDILTREHVITNDYIDHLYANYGIENFKISGRRNNHVTYVEAILYYLIKPEYRDAVRQSALMCIFNIT